jgi:hypothetical protein
VNELVVMAEDRLVDGIQVELGTALVEETKGVKLPDNWYKLNPFRPPTDFQTVCCACHIAYNVTLREQGISDRKKYPHIVRQLL